MKVTIDNQTLRIRWKHNFQVKKTIKVIESAPGGDRVIEKQITVPLKANRYTDCFIEIGNGKDAQVIATGRALCAKGDIWCKCEGRKVSLQKAISIIRADKNCSVKLNREARIAIWKEYVKTTNCSFTVSEVPKRGLKTNSEVEVEIPDLEQAF